MGQSTEIERPQITLKTVTIEENYALAVKSVHSQYIINYYIRDLYEVLKEKTKITTYQQVEMNNTLTVAAVDG
jgi:hypothetical protein